MATAKDEIAALRDEIRELREQLGAALAHLALHQGGCVHYHWNVPSYPAPYPWSPAYPVYPVVTYDNTAAPPSSIAAG